jgi:hypothetical protein
MTTWLYQISPEQWSPERYRFEIWEGERWAWPVGSKSSGGELPEPGDVIVFFYSPTGGMDPGFYGWAVVLEWFPGSSTPLAFRPVAPSDHLKMHPWWDDEAIELADVIRGKMKRRTLWIVPEELVARLRQGITSWLAGQSMEE